MTELTQRPFTPEVLAELGLFMNPNTQLARGTGYKNSSGRTTRRIHHMVRLNEEQLKALSPEQRREYDSAVIEVPRDKPEGTEMAKAKGKFSSWAKKTGGTVGAVALTGAAVTGVAVLTGAGLYVGYFAAAAVLSTLTAPKTPLG